MTAQEGAFLNACDCLRHGFSKKYWNRCGLSEEEAQEGWDKELEEITQF